MFEIVLKNNKSFTCERETTILNAAINSGIILEHSCLSARCRSCVVKVLEGKTKEIEQEYVLSEKEKEQGFILTCNSTPISNITLDIEDLDQALMVKSRTLPSKINSIENVSDSVLKIKLRLPPNSSFKFIEGQYINIIKGNIKRSYSIANYNSPNGLLEFFIKKYENGIMSKYWFSEAKENDLLRLVGPLGTFFYRENSIENIVFLATGTGIAPVKAMLEQFNANPELFVDKKIWLFWGGRNEKDIFWKPDFKNIDLKFVPVLSREKNVLNGERGYVQDVFLKKKIDLINAQVYACGSNDMINSSYELLIKNSLPESQFFSDAFVCSN